MHVHEAEYAYQVHPTKCRARTVAQDNLSCGLQMHGVVLRNYVPDL